MNQEFHKCKISNIVEHNNKTKRFFIEYPFDVTFQSGQFIIIDFENLNHQFNTRSYSIADYTKGNTIELCIVLKEEGEATPRLFDHKIGDSLLCSMPQGRFVLPEIINNNVEIAFICTGTGVAPFRAMIKELLLERKLKNELKLYFGCRNQEELLYRADFETLAKNYPNFQYYPVLSRETWNGLTGYVHPHYMAHYQNKPEAILYLCGWTDMVKETRDNLKSIGYTRQEIKVEFYD
jgi:CDP-4-dehydro-6-deoxyglucose reductase